MIARSAVLLAALSLSACITADAVKTQNRERLLSLSLGMNKPQALAAMGTESIQVFDRVSGLPAGKINNPYRTEAYQAGGHQWEILLYYTDLKADDGAITDDELTPLVLKDGVLDGWGWSYWRGVVETYEIRIR